MLTNLRRAALLCLVLALVVTGAALAAKPKSGKYEGKVAAGYGGPQMQFSVKGGKVKDLIARMFYSCNNGPQQQTVVAPSKAIKVGKSGAFSSKTTESIGGVASETVWIKGKF